MVSKTRMEALVRAFAWREVAAALEVSPPLKDVRDKQGRNWLHICCGSDVRQQGRLAEDSIRTADALLAAGFDLDREAFREGEWRATPLWYAVAWGNNITLAEHLLKLGSTPRYCLFAAVWNGDFDALRLLVANGADVDERSADETPFLGAVKWSRFAAAEVLLELGADPNARDSQGRTALHCMLKKGGDKTHFEMLVRRGARLDIPDADGNTAAQLMRRKRDPDFHRLAIG